MSYDTKMQSGDTLDLDYIVPVEAVARACKANPEGKA